MANIECSRRFGSQVLEKAKSDMSELKKIPTETANQVGTTATATAGVAYRERFVVTTFTSWTL